MSWLKEKLMSRKFLVVVGTVVAAATGAVGWDDAIQVITAWIVGQSAIDAVSASKK